MGLIKREYCDLCGNFEDLGDYVVIKAKQKWNSWYESGYTRRKILICERCIKSLREAAKEDRILEKERNGVENK